MTATMMLVFASAWFTDVIGESSCSIPNSESENVLRCSCYFRRFLSWSRCPS
jgi:hypothetical protein